MAMSISKEGQEITKRFFQAIDILAEANYFRGLQTFTTRYGLNRRNLQHVKESPANTVLKPEVMAHLVSDYGISGTWLLTGEGTVFQDGSNKPEPVVWKNKPRVIQTNPVESVSASDQE